ncbi:AAA family ATPase [Wenzhouxiangella sp. XN24]|uniref:AAA family ATPase n=1 Tax=Wenzhouxiangella sp. XN24 TaxID=2713569 RepID=UPI0013EB6FD0|nr:AAA family ATPase [Wenzhouxiangella sp. XN24]NGX16155.1 AAA family ATPase [Wenzhouxiangella sp. XN24]
MIDHENGGSGKRSSRGQLIAKAVGAFVDKARVPDSIDRKVALLEALFSATEGVNEGLAVATAWSSTWPDDPGDEMIGRLWDQWRMEGAKPKLDLLEDFLRGQGWNWEEYLSHEEIEAIQSSSLPAATSEPEISKPLPSVLLKFSLVDELPKLQSEVLTSEPLCSGLAVKGSATVWYAEPNTGKTAMALWFLVSDIQDGRLDPSRVFYFNLDDTLQGLAEKTSIAQLHGFHVISEGYKSFEARHFPTVIRDLIAADQCSGVVIFLDVLKKLCDIMDKGKSSSFGKLIRSFVLRGGTCIALAHTNKRRNADGEPIYAGTSDILEDFDCGFIVYETDLDLDSQTKTILFKNKKSRGTVRKQASFRYSVREGLSYDELLASIQEVDEADLLRAQQQKQLESDLSLIEVVRDGIRSDINTKMALAALLVQRTQCSKRTAIRVIEQYDGTDPETHFWNFQVGARGAKMYRLLGQ